MAYLKISQKLIDNWPIAVKTIEDRLKIAMHDAARGHDMQNQLVKAKVFQESGKLWVTSRDVATDFKKNHNQVLRDIRNLESSEEFNQSNFGLVEYTDAKGENRPMYKMTRDGFTFLAMGFTGPPAAQFKEAYIALFNEYEKSFQNQGDYLDRLTALHEKWSQLHISSRTQIDELKHTVYENHESRICKVEEKTKVRKKPSKACQKILLRFVKAPIAEGGYSDRCPICHADLKAGYEFDHATSVDKADRYNCWVLCELCNRKLGHPNGLQRNEIEPAYKEWRRRFDVWEKGYKRDPLFRKKYK